jgi:hypothetical protein
MKKHGKNNKNNCLRIFLLKLYCKHILSMVYLISLQKNSIDFKKATSIFIERKIKNDVDNNKSACYINKVASGRQAN